MSSCLKSTNGSKMLYAFIFVVSVVFLVLWKWSGSYVISFPGIISRGILYNDTCLGNTSSRDSNVSAGDLPYCISNIKLSIFTLSLGNFTAREVVHSHSSAKTGRWRPKDCLAKFRLAVMVPLRGRGLHNYTFLMNMHRYFQMHQYDYGIFIIEQTFHDRFNRGMLFNVGFLEINKRWPNIYDCYALHDVDVFPMNSTISYQCSSEEIAMVHLGNALSRFNYKLPYAQYTGAVSLVSKNTYLKSNGFSNIYFGWGAEDDDFTNRLNRIGGKIIRYPTNKTMMYMLGHSGRDRNSKRVTLLDNWRKRHFYDGVQTMPPYDIKEVSSESCAFKITVELDEKQVNHNITQRMKAKS